MGKNDFIKQTVIDCLASSSKIRNDAEIKIINKVKQEMNKQEIGLGICEAYRETNSYEISGMDSTLHIYVRGLYIAFFAQV